VFELRAAVDAAAAARRAGRGSDADVDAARKALSVGEDLVKACAAAADIT
jgi:hypothetical protein